MSWRGAQWLPAWIEAGFTTRGTNVPKRIEARAAKRERDAAETTLRRTLRQVMLLLGVCIGASDERWTVFGLCPPPRQSPPGCAAHATPGHRTSHALCPSHV